MKRQIKQMTEEELVEFLNRAPEKYYAEKEYYDLAKKILGRRPEVAYLPLPKMDWETGKPVEHKRFPGDLTDRDDAKLRVACKCSLADWKAASIIQRIEFLRVIEATTPKKNKQKRKS